MPARSGKTKRRKHLNESRGVSACVTASPRVLENALSELSNNERRQLHSQAASILGRLGGQKGGKARAARLSAGRRAEIARRAAVARWHRS